MSPTVYAFLLHFIGISLLGAFFFLIGALIAVLLWYPYKSRVERVERENAQLSAEHERLQAQWTSLQS